MLTKADVGTYTYPPAGQAQPHGVSPISGSGGTKTALAPSKSRCGMVRSLVVVLFATFGCSSLCWADCEPHIAGLDNYLRSNPGWKLVQVKDLQEDDREFWGEKHAGQCPGYTSVRFYGTQDAHVVALAEKTQNGFREKLILLRAGPPFSCVVLARPDVYPTPAVVFNAPAGTYFDERTRKNTAVPHEAIIYSKLESWSLLFYWHLKGFHELTLSN